MSRAICRCLLALAVPAALAGCQDGADPLAPDAAGDPTTAASAPAPLGALASNRIAYAAYTAEDSSDIWSMDPQGGSFTHLTNFAGEESHPSWSYDHGRLAFVRYRIGADNYQHADIYLMDAGGGNKRWARAALYSGDLREPSWAPNGSRLVLTATLQGNRALATLDLATGNLSLVAPQGLFGVVGRSPIYDPAGKTIFYVDATGKSIKRFTPGGSQTTVLTSASYLHDLAVSPDGTRLAYSADLTSTNPEIFVLNLATKVSKRLTFHSARDARPSWSPDGTRLAFGSTRSGRWQIWTMSAATGGSLVRITSHSFGAAWPAWTH